MKTDMKINGISIMAALAALCLCIVSCKKDKDEETVSYSSFRGDLSFEIPSYVHKGDVYELIPGGDIRRAADDDNEGAYGLVWTVDLRSASDTVRFEGEDASTNDGSMIFSVPDTLCNITLTLKAFADGYASTSVSRTIMVIDPSEENGSLTGRTFPAGVKSFKDARDGENYRYVRVGGRDWMAENLAWDGAGNSFDNAPVMDALLGRFYTWEEAQNACPAGWRLPANDDWIALAADVTGKTYTDKMSVLEGLSGAMMLPEAYINEYRMWEYQPKFDVDNRTGLAVLPAGYSTVKEDDWAFFGFTRYALFWTADAFDADNGCYRQIHADQPGVSAGYAGKAYFGASVRCVR